MDFKMKTKILRRDIAKEMLIDILDKVYGSELNHAAILSIVDSCLREIGPYLRDNDPSEQDSVTSFGSCGRNCRKRRRNNNNTKKKILTNHETNDRTVHDNGATVLRETSGGNRATSDSVRSGYVVESDNESRVRPTQGRDCPDMNSKVMSVIEGMIMDLNNFARSRVQDSEASSGYSRPCQQRSKSSRRPCVTREDRMYQVNFFDSEPCSSRVSSHDLYGKPPSEFSRGSSRWNDQYRRPVSADPINPYKKLKNDLENALRSMQTTCYDDERVSQPVLPTSAQCHDELLANITDIMTASNGMSTAASGGVTPTHRQTVVYRDVMKCPSCLSMYDGSIGSENTAIYPCKSGMKKIKYANSVASSTPTDVFTKPNNNKDLVSPSQMFLITRDIIRAVLNEPRDPQPTPCDRALEQQHALSKQGVAKAKARSQNNGDYFKQKTNFKHEVVESKDDHSIDKRVCYNTSNERARGYETHDVSADIRDHRLDFDDNNPESPGKRRETDGNTVLHYLVLDPPGPGVFRATSLDDSLTSSHLLTHSVSETTMASKPPAVPKLSRLPVPLPRACPQNRKRRLSETDNQAPVSSGGVARGGVSRARSTQDISASFHSYGGGATRSHVNASYHPTSRFDQNIPPKLTGRASSALTRVVQKRPPVVTGRPSTYARRRRSASFSGTVNRPSGTRNVGASRGGSNTRAPLVDTNDGGANVRRPKKVRPKWDVKGILADMKEDYADILAECERLKDDEARNEEEEPIGELEIQLEQLRREVEEEEQKKANDLPLINELTRSIENFDRQLIEDEQNDEEILNRLRQELEQVERERLALEQTLNTLTIENEGLATTERELDENLDELTRELETETAENVTLKEDEREMEREKGEIEATITEKTTESEMTRDEIIELETELRTLRNTYQELKGNIRVFCRIRPCLSNENNETKAQINFLDNKSISIVNPNERTTVSGASRPQELIDFSFDCVFMPESNQSEVFGEISQLVQSALDGYNVCIFAYGQTGSGKTYTMDGPPNVNQETCGMIPRAVTQVFSYTEELATRGWNFVFETSIVEIYLESIRDLLADGKAAAKPINLRQNQGDVDVTNITTVTVTTESEVHTLLKKAKKNRAVGETQCNLRSSRSHSVFRLKITGNNSLSSEKSEGWLNLIDLAGSERLNSSGSEGQRLKETQSINQSLSQLQSVIAARTKKDSHVPYRNSKLTFLLKNSLQGNSKILMFVNVSPLHKYVNETLCSLRFATKVNACHVGTAPKRVIKTETSATQH